MKKIFTLSLAAASAVLMLTGCTCPVCQGAGLQTVYSTYQKVPGGPMYKETATVRCMGCWGSGRNWGSWFGFVWATDVGLHAADHFAHPYHPAPPARHHHMPAPGPVHGGPGPRH